MLVQGAGGGVATALIALARPAGSGCSPPAVTRPSGQRRSSSAPTRCSSPARGCRQGRRGDGDRRRGDLVALGPVAAAGRHARHQRRDLGPQPAAELTRIFFLQLGRRLDHGHPRRARIARLDAGRDRGSARSSIATLPMERAREGFAAMASRSRRRSPAISASSLYWSMAHGRRRRPICPIQKSHSCVATRWRCETHTSAGMPRS